MHSFQEVSTPDQRETLFKSYRSFFVNLLKMQDAGPEEELPDAVNLVYFRFFPGFSGGYISTGMHDVALAVFFSEIRGPEKGRQPLIISLSVLRCNFTVILSQYFVF